MEQQLAYTQHAGPVPPPPLPQAPPPGKKAVSIPTFIFSFLLDLNVMVSFVNVLFQVNGAPPSECGGGEEDAGASYVELGQGGQEVFTNNSLDLIYISTSRSKPLI